ncbi:hypothetical protein N3K66_006044 [Trichothecium roseum]|uniref:Uncharacterized protein n=1 Tax=Trichothecium roseum TaxID=47278 RepID=A0ACC0V110_9HYPO|nr:hypothetical protein N3K66_006044 [Trichothecium roseum]
MRVQRQMFITVPIPPGLPPSAVVATLQTVSPVIRNLGTLSRYEQTAAGSGPVATDPFFILGSSGGGDSNNNNNNNNNSAGDVASYQIFELITLAPGLTKEVTYPAYFQRVNDGLRVRANGAAGITGWAGFTVRPRRSPGDNGGNSAPLVVDSPDGGGESGSTPSTTAGSDRNDGGGGGGGGEEYELFESLTVEANSLLMPFVCQTMQIAHRGLCDKVLQEAMDRLTQSPGWQQHQQQQPTPPHGR